MVRILGLVRSPKLLSRAHARRKIVAETHPWNTVSLNTVYTEIALPGRVSFESLGWLILGSFFD